MSIPARTDNFYDAVGTYYLSGNYYAGCYYLFRVEFRTNNSSNGDPGGFTISVIATNSDPNDLAIASYSVATNGVTTNYSDIFVKTNYGWPRMTLTRLSSVDWGTIQYYNSNEGYDASSRTEAYIGINGSGTGYASYELHSFAAYTSLIYGQLTANVKYANNAGWAKANDVYDWAKASSKPSYTASEVGAASAPYVNEYLPYAKYGNDSHYSDVSNSFIGGVSGGPRVNGWEFLYRAQHRNGYGDGPNYIMEMVSDLTSDSSIYWRKKTGGSDFTPFREIIDSNNIGSQSVSYATYSTSSHLLRTYSSTDSSHGEDFMLKCRYNLDGDYRFKLHIIRSDGTVTGPTSVDYANTSGTANYFAYGRGVSLPNSSSFTNNFNKDIFGEENNNNFHLVELRTSSQAPSCLLGDYSSGIAWKGSDTYGSLMVRYNTPEIRISGGNGHNTNPNWTVDLVHSGNIGSQSVNYANSAGSARANNISMSFSNGVLTITYN